MTKKLRVLVDIDESLARTKQFYFPHEKCPPGFTEFTIMLGDKPKKRVRAGTIIRPSSREFLTRLNAKYAVDAFSSGGRDFQSRVLELLGLRELIDTVWGFEHWDELSKNRPERWVLVDDLTTWCSGFESKFGVMGYRAMDLKCDWQQKVRRDDGSVWEGERWEALTQRHFVQCQQFDGGADPEPLTVLLDRVDACFALQETPLPFSLKR